MISQLLTLPGRGTPSHPMGCLPSKAEERVNIGEKSFFFKSHVEVSAFSYTEKSRVDVNIPQNRAVVPKRFWLLCHQLNFTLPGVHSCAF
jgi:hypothetical protein